VLDTVVVSCPSLNLTRRRPVPATSPPAAATDADDDDFFTELTDESCRLKWNSKWPSTKKSHTS